MLIPSLNRVVVLILLTLGLTGCGKADLDRISAQKIITNHFKYPIPVTMPVIIGSKVIATDSKEWLGSFQNEGLIDYKVDVDNQRYGLADIVSVSLTDKGKGYVAGEETSRLPSGTIQKHAVIKIGEKQFHEVTGIRMLDDKKTAIVEYTWKYKFQFSGLARVLGKFWRQDFGEEQDHKEEVSIALYDDGWRIK